MEPSESKRIKLASDDMPTNGLTNEDRTIFNNLTNTNRYINELKSTEFKYELDNSTVIKIQEYLNNEATENILLISSAFYILTLIKVIQCLECPEDCLVINVKLNETVPNQIIKNIKNSKFSIIIFDTNVGLEALLQTLENHTSKIFIITSAEISYNSSIIDEAGFKDLQSDSKQTILNRSFTLDGVDVPIHKLGSIDFFDDLNDSTWLSTLLTDGKLIINKRNLLVFDEKSHIDRTLELHSDEISKTDSDEASSEDTNDCTDNSVSEDKMIELENKLIIVSDQQGTGKTNLLSSILNKIKKRDPSSWIEIITLTNHIQDLRKINSIDSIDFLSKDILKYDLFTSKLFKHQIDVNNNMILMFDGFDELSESDKQSVIEFIKNLLKTNVKHIWITERNRSLEEKLSERSYQIYSFMYRNKVKYFVNYWTGNCKNYELETLAGSLMDQIHRYEIQHEVPLITEMLAEYLVNNYLNMDSKLPKDFSKTSLYGKFIRSKHSQEFDKVHQRIALKLLCPEYGQKENLSENEITVINSIGIAAVHDGEMINFIHQELAEFYVAQNILNVLSDENSNDDRILDFLLVEVIYKSNFEGVKYFLNYLIPSVSLSQKTFKKMSERIRILIENNSIEVNDDSKQFLENDPPYSYRDQENIVKINYESVHLLNLENVERYKKYLPKIKLESSIDLKFFEKLLDDNLMVVQYDLTDLEFLYGILRLDLIDILKKYFLSLEKQLETNEKLKEFLLLKYPKDCIPQHTFLSYVGKNCLDFLLNYLREKITPIEDLKSFLVITNDYECYFPKVFKMNLPWIESLGDDNFYELCTRLSNIDVNEKEEKCIEYHKEIVSSKIFDNLLFSHNLLVNVIKREYPKAVEKILEFMEKPIKENGKFEDMNKIMETTTYYGTFEILKKILQFYLKAFINKKEQLMKVIISPINLLTFDELKMILDSENFQHYSPTLKMHIRTIGIVGILLRVVLSRKEEAQTNFDEFIKNELQPIITYNDDELKIVISQLNASGNYSYVMHYVQEALSMEGLFKILHLMLPEPYADICCKNTLISDYCYYLLEKNIFFPPNFPTIYRLNRKIINTTAFGS